MYLTFTVLRRTTSAQLKLGFVQDGRRARVQKSLLAPRLFPFHSISSSLFIFCLPLLAMIHGLSLKLLVRFI